MSWTDTVDLFVPGRLCLFGEHSDWAGEYRREDPGIEMGFCIVACTDQGIQASAESSDKGFHISQVLPDGSMSDEVSFLNAGEALLGASDQNSFHAYAAGTASLIMREHPNKGLRLRVYSRTLPLKKGLSSSAAVCVATARAFSRIHNLGFSIPEEMEIAYKGEMLTGSQCGRMDQACAWGTGSVFLTFDGDRIFTEILDTREPVRIVIADLGGKKDTRKILRDLNRSFLEGNKSIRKALGEENRNIAEQAREAMETGNTVELGRLMNKAQEIFDRLVAPCSPIELESPKLHHALDTAKKSGLILGGKGVGSQGDGTAQFLCSGEEERQQLVRLLENIPGTQSYYLTI